MNKAIKALHKAGEWRVFAFCDDLVIFLGYNRQHRYLSLPIFPMSILWLLLVGLIAGWLAGQLVKGSGFGVVGDIVVGIVGALIGGWLAGRFGIATYGLLGEIIMAVVGAVILLFVLRLFSKGRA